MIRREGDFAPGAPLRYDLHIHSALSPCADNDMTPSNIVNMAVVAGLDIIAVTDHNSAKNLPPIAELAARSRLGFIPGIEVNTAEDIHLLCYFNKLADAMEFSDLLYPTLLPVRNRPEAFGEQLLLGADDNIIGEEPNLLIVASSLSLADAVGAASRYSCICIPAHIDKPANGMLSVLGAFTPDVPFSFFEAISPEALRARPDAAEIFTGREWIVNSDAHYLHEVGTNEQLLAPSHGLYEFMQRFMRGI